MKRNINHFDNYTNSWFTDEVYENEFVTKFYQFIANLLPRRLIYFCYIRLMAFATTHGEGIYMQPDQITFSKAIEIWEQYEFSE